MKNKKKSTLTPGPSPLQGEGNTLIPGASPRASTGSAGGEGKVLRRTGEVGFCQGCGGLVDVVVEEGDRLQERTAAVMEQMGFYLLNAPSREEQAALLRILLVDMQTLLIGMAKLVGDVCGERVVLMREAAETVESRQ